jgi:transcriptional regulator with XRE-family HTH domain
MSLYLSWGGTCRPGVWKPSLQMVGRRRMSATNSWLVGRRRMSRRRRSSHGLAVNESWRRPLTLARHNPRVGEPVHQSRRLRASKVQGRVVRFPTPQPRITGESPRGRTADGFPLPGVFRTWDIRQSNFPDSRKRNAKKQNFPPHPVDIHVGQKVKSIRQERKLSMMKLGRSIVVTYQQLQKYEAGVNRISSSKLYMIAQVLEVEDQPKATNAPRRKTARLHPCKNRDFRTAPRGSDFWPDRFGKLRISVTKCGSSNNNATSDNASHWLPRILFRPTF